MIRLAMAVIVFLSLSSCAKMLMPYEENPACQLGKDGGVCGSISDVYIDINRNPWRYGIED